MPQIEVGENLTWLIIILAFFALIGFGFISDCSGPSANQVEIEEIKSCEALKGTPVIGKFSEVVQHFVGNEYAGCNVGGKIQ